MNRYIINIVLFLKELFLFPNPPVAMSEKYFRPNQNPDEMVYLVFHEPSKRYAVRMPDEAEPLGFVVCTSASENAYQQISQMARQLNNNRKSHA